jgi:hypothetical protein
LEKSDGDFLSFLTTDCIAYHLYTRTKTGRSKALRDAVPDAFILMNAHSDGTYACGP